MLSYFVGAPIMARTLWQASALCGISFLIAGCERPLKVGTAAPDFTGITDEGKTFRLADLKGRCGVVLYFYPKDETPGCITQACAFRDRLARFESKGYTVVGVSLDSIDSHREFKAKYNLPLTLISDDGKIARKYGVPMASKIIGGKPCLLLERETYVIDRDGIIRQHFDVKDPEEQARKAEEWAYYELGWPY
jgi:peroxiredoxin Q/BCP